MVRSGRVLPTSVKSPYRIENPGQYYILTERDAHKNAFKGHPPGIIPEQSGCEYGKESGNSIQFKIICPGLYSRSSGSGGPAIIMESRLASTRHFGEMMEDRASFLIIAALKLVMMNVIRAVPHYLGAFLINESVHIYLYGKRDLHSILYLLCP